MVAGCGDSSDHSGVMADWVHCNLCFVQPGKTTPFHITSCGHIYCGKCVTKGSKDSCKMCASKNSTMELTGNMKPDVEMFFVEPLDMISKSFKKFMQVYEFQRNHRRRFYTHLLSTVEEQKKVFQEIQRMMASYQSIEKEYMKLKEENIYLKKLVQDKGLSGSRPSSRSGFSPIFRSSPTGAMAKHTSLSGSRHGSANFATHYDMGSSSSQMMSYGYSSQATQPSITPDRIIARTPPQGGRMGTVGSRSPADHMMSFKSTPQSVPHAIYTPSLSGSPD